MRSGERYTLFALALAVHVAAVLVLLRDSPWSLQTGFQASSMSGGGDLIAVDLEPAHTAAVPEPRPAETPTNALSMPGKPADARTLAHRSRMPRIDAPASPDAEGGAARGVASGLPTASVADGVASDYARVLLAHIEHNKRYPDIPGSEQPRGIVRVQFKLARDGSVLGVWIRASSGSTALDREAVATLMRGQPLPAIPAGLPDPMDFSFDIEFSPPQTGLRG